MDVGVRRPDRAWRWPDWLLCSPEDQRQLTRLLCENQQSVWHAAPEIEHYFKRIGDVLAQPPGPRVATRLALHINELLVAILEMLQQRRATPLPAPAQARQRVETFISQLPALLRQPGDLSTMARHCQLGRSQFTHYCQELTNMTPRQLLETCRISQAQRLLRQRPRLSVTQVALECGFSSSQYFSTVFRRHTSSPPRIWRKPARPTTC